MMTPEALHRLLQHSDLKKIADGSHLPYQTIYKFASAPEVKRPSYELILKLSIYFESIGVYIDGAVAPSSEGSQ